VSLAIEFIPDRAFSPAYATSRIHPNTFGVTVGRTERELGGMSALDPEAVVRENLDVPADAPTERLDVRNLGPPKPLKNTLERLADLDDETVLVQINDREPQFLYPKLEDRGYAYGTVETDKAVVTGIWTS